MPFASGPEGTIRIPVEATGEEKISDDIFNAFMKGLDQVVRSPAFKKGFDRLIMSVVKSMEKQFEASNKRIERQLNNLFKNVPKSAQQASTAAANSLNHMVPSGVEGAINRLIKQFDRLNATVSKPPDLGLERILERINRTLAASQTELSRQQTAAANTAIQQETAAANAAAKKRVEIWRIMSRQLVLIERGIGKVISATFATAEKVVASFARGTVAVLRGVGRGAEAAFRGLARVVSSTFSAMTRTISAFARGAGRGFSGIFNGFRAALRRQERDLSSSLAHQQRQIQNFQQQSSRGLTGLLTRGGALAGGFGIGALLSSGFTRAGAEEQLQLTFTTLLGSASKAETVLASLSEFARTTSFDFVEVAGSVAQLTAALGDVGKAEELTKFLADVTALTGGTTESLSHIRLAISQIASAGKLDASNLRQLSESLPGIPFAQILADRFFAGDLKAFSAARDEGELGGLISSEAFFDAFEEGVRTRFPDVEGFAVRAAGTLTGLAANMKENFAIFGAQIIRLFEGPIKAAIDGINRGLGFLGDFLSGDMFDPEFFQIGGGFMQIGQDEANIERLKRLREIIFNVAKAIGGLLAIKGITELLKFFGIALRRLLTPLGLLSLAILGFAAIFNKLLEVTPWLRENFKVLGDQIKPTLKELGRLGKALFNLFFGDKGAKGGDSIFLKIGRAVQKFIIFIARGLVTIRTFAKLMADLLNAGRGDIAFEVIRIRLKGLVDDIAKFLGVGLFDRLNARLRGGNDFLNILEATFLGPIIRFFRGPFSDGIEGLGSVIGDIFNAIFGGGGGGGNGVLTADNNIGGDSIGTKILDRLEDTFLGPVVRFFRGFVADVVERIGGGVADFGGFLGEIFNAIFGDDPGGVGTRILNVLDSTFLGPVVRFFRGPFADGVEAVASFAVDAFRTIVDAIQGFLTLIEPLTDAIGRFFKNLFGGSNEPQGKFKIDLGEDGGLSGIWKQLGETLGNVGEKVAELLSPVWTAISGWFTRTFTPKNLTTVGIAVLKIAEEIGRVLGKIVTDPRFVIGLALAAAAILTVVGAAIVGVFEGVIENADEWGGLLVDGLTTAFEFIKTEGPGLLADALAAVVNSPSLGIGLVVGALLFGTSFGRNIISGFVGIFTNRTETGRMRAAVTRGIVDANIGAGVTAGLDQSKLGAGIPVRFRDQLKTLGRNIASIVAGGIVAFEIGNIAGRQGGFGAVLLGILGGAVTGASVGALIGGPLGAGIGAALGAGIAGVGAIFGNNARQAQNAREQVDLYADALRDLNAVDQPTAIADVIRQTLSDAGTDAFDAWGRALVKMADFDFEAFGQRLVDGISTPAGEATIFLQGLRDEVADLGSGELGTAIFDDFIAVMDKFNISLSDLDRAGVSGDVLQHLREMGLSDASLQSLQQGVLLLEQLGITEGDLSTIHGVLTGSSDSVTQALKNLALEAELGLSGVADAAPLVGKFDEVTGAVSDLGKELNDTQQKISDLFDIGTYGGSFDAFQDDLAIELAGVEEQLATALEGVDPTSEQGRAIQSQFQGNFGDMILGGINAGIADGTITTGNALDAYLGIIQDQIRDIEGDPGDANSPLETMLLAALANTDYAAIGAELDNQAATIADMTTKALTGGGFTKPVAGQPATGGAGGDLVTALAGGVTANNNVLTAALTTAARTSFDAVSTDANVLSSGTTAGKAAGAILADGLTSMEPTIEAAGFAAAGAYAAGFKKGEAVMNALNAAQAPPPGGGATRKVANTRPEAGITIDQSGIAAAREHVAKIQAIFIAGAVRALKAGAAVGTAFTEGVKSGSSNAVSIVSALSFQVGLTPFKAAPLMYGAGKAMSSGFAQGIRDAGAQAVAQAAAVAARVVAITRLILQSHSPSLVFRDIGRDIGRGFIQGIKDSEGDMTEAIGTAIEKAITAGAARAGAAVRRAQVGQAIFDTLASSALPGGTTNASLAQSRASLTQSIGGVLGDLRSGAAGLLGDNANTQLREARDQLNGMVLDLKIGFESTRKDVADALAAQKELATFDWQRDFLNRAKASGALGQAEFTKQLNELKSQLSSGALSQDAYNKKLAVLNNELASGKLNLDKFNEKMKELGSRPTALTISQLDLIRSGARSLNTGTLAGQANTGTISTALGTIREFGAAALEAGSPLNAVIAEMQRYRNELVRQATAQGFSKTAIAQLVNAYGLSDAALNTFRTNLTSLNIGTVAGAQNVAKITDSLQAIRDYGAELVAAGISTATVVTQLKQYRDQLVKQATTFGFNATQIKALVEQAGLSDTALANFVKQLKDFDTEARNAAAVSKAAAKAAAEKAAAEAAAAAAAGKSPGVAPGALDRPVIENMNLFLPSGDPEAVGLAVVNRLAYGLLVGG